MAEILRPFEADFAVLDLRSKSKRDSIPASARRFEFTMRASLLVYELSVQVKCNLFGNDSRPPLSAIGNRINSLETVSVTMNRIGEAQFISMLESLLLGLFGAFPGLLNVGLARLE